MSELANKLINEAYEKRSTFLDLGNCGLREIPKEIVILKDFLEHLSLGGWYYANNENVRSVNKLDINYFLYSNESFRILSEFENITSLDVNNNGITEAGIMHISRLASLKFLNIGHNDIGDQGAQHITKLNSLNSLILDHNKIGDRGAKYISALKSLTRLNLEYNRIGAPGAEYISTLSSLTSLNLDENQIGSQGAKNISRLNSLTALNLVNNRIGDQGAEYISKLSSLISLSLYNNRIGVQGAEYISRLNSLTSLNLNSNQIGGQGAQYVSRLNSLTSLNLNGNKIGDHGAQYISRLISINLLNINGNQIGDQGAEYISRLISLTSLTLENNQIGDHGAEHISTLKSLTFLDLGLNKIGDRGAKYISKLNSLSSLTLNDNRIGDRGAEYISKLNSLTSLNLDGNKIRDQGAEYFCEMPSLTELGLSSNNISRFSPGISNVLRTLRLQNNRFETITLDLIKYIELEIDIEHTESHNSSNIFLSGNPIISPPSEVIRRGRNAILEYLEGKLRPLNECKLIFIGDGGVGKTSLMKQLVYNEFTLGEETTHGINKIAWKGLKNEQGEPIKVNLWDFGGQHVQHSLHQFFFTERVVYVLVLNPRNDEKAGYWLDQVDKLGRNSQIILVFNWKDVGDKQADFLRNFQELRKTYKYLPKPIVLSCATGDGISDFLAAVKTAVLANEGLRVQYPESWFNIKEKLETRIPIEKHYIKYDEYEAWCAEEQYDDPDRRRNLLKILDSVGSIVFFDKPVLNELQVLNPEWISTGAYAIITAELTKENKGHLTWNDLCVIFNEEKEIFSDKKIRIKYQQAQFKFILQLMLDYQLCQTNPFETHGYLIPSAFGEKPNKEYDLNGGRHYRLKFGSPFEMLIIHRFIAKNIVNIISTDYWNSGIYFKHSGSETFALVETNQYSKVIDCWIKGENIRGMWEVIRNDFRDIFNLYQNFEVDEEVEYTSAERIVFLNYSEMIQALKNGFFLIPYDTKTGLRDIDVYYVLELFDAPDPNKRNMSHEPSRIEINPQINVNPQINISPQITNSPAVNVNHQEPAAKPKYDIAAEDRAIKRWKNKALVTCIVSTIITVLLVIISLNKSFFDPSFWNKVEKYNLDKWLGIPIGVIWNGFIIKSVYDRFLDPSKAKAYRENLRK